MTRRSPAEKKQQYCAVVTPDDVLPHLVMTEGGWSSEIESVKMFRSVRATHTFINTKFVGARHTSYEVITEEELDRRRVEREISNE